MSGYTTRHAWLRGKKKETDFPIELQDRGVEGETWDRTAFKAESCIDQVANLVNTRPDIPRDNKPVSDLSVALTWVEIFILLLSDRLPEPVERRS